MARRKVKLAFIVNDKARKVTYKKRKNGLMKKVDELIILCGIEACAIVYGPDDLQPEVFPSPYGVLKVLERLISMPELEQRKKMVNQETFLKQMIVKAQDQVMKQVKDNREKEMNFHMFRCINARKVLPNMTTNDLNDLAWVIDRNLKEVDRVLETMDKSMTPIQPQIAPALAQELALAPTPTPAPAPTPAIVAAKLKEMTLVNDVHGQVMNNDNAMKKSSYMDLINYENETVPLFGDANLQNGWFWLNRQS